MKELLLKRKTKFFQYLLATFMFIVDHFARMGIFALILGGIERADMKYYKYVLLFTVLFIIYSPLNFLISRLLRIGYMRDTILDVRRQAFDKIMNMSFKQYSQKSKEVYISNLVNDINTFENKFFVSFLNFLINIGMFVFSLIFLCMMDYKLAIGMLFACVIIFLFATLFTKQSTKLEQQVSNKNEEFTTEISNTFHGIEILKLNNIEDKFLKKSVRSISELEKRKYEANVFTELQINVIHIFAYVITVFVLLYLSNEIRFGMTLTIAAFLFQLSSSMSNYLIRAFPMWNQCKASISIYKKIAESEEFGENKHIGTKNFDFQHVIEAKNVSFAYDDKAIFTNASFQIEKGKKYLIKGVSGAGKSTLMNLLAMIYDNYSGDILVDGLDYRDISEQSFNDRVAFIYQDVFLFEDTIKNNISLYKEIPEEQINYAAKVCGLDSVIQDKSNGINEMLTENGKNLSGGQRQRISIARAIAKNAEILFVDEGTSSLNEELGKEIEQVFLSLDNTVISISHRFYEGVTDAYDYVLEVKNGAVIKYQAKEYFEEVVTW